VLCCAALLPTPSRVHRYIGLGCTLAQRVMSPVASQSQLLQLQGRGCEARQLTPAREVLVLQQEHHQHSCTEQARKGLPLVSTIWPWPELQVGQPNAGGYHRPTDRGQEGACDASSYVCQFLSLESHDQTCALLQSLSRARLCRCARPPCSAAMCLDASSYVCQFLSLESHDQTCALLQSLSRAQLCRCARPPCSAAMCPLTWLQL